MHCPPVPPRPPSNWLKVDLSSGIYMVGVHTTCGKILPAAVTVASHSTWLQRPIEAGQHSDTRECTAETIRERSVAVPIAKTIRNTALCIKDLIDRRRDLIVLVAIGILYSAPPETSQSGFPTYLRGAAPRGRGPSR